MLINPDSTVSVMVESWKIWAFLLSTFASIVLGGYKIYQWIRGIRTEEFPTLKTGMNEISTKIEETSAAQLRSTEFQTQSMVRELAELRGLLYGAFHVASPAMAPARSRAPRKPAAKATKIAMSPARKAPKRVKK